MGKMIYTISTQHLNHILEEFKQMTNTRIIGYGNPKRALSGLLEINTAEIYGYIIVDYEIDREDRGYYAKLIKTIDRVVKKGTLMMIGLAETDNLGAILKAVKPVNLEIRLFTYDVLTDSDIRRELIGPILLKEETPYVKKVVEVINRDDFKMPVFGIPNTFSKEYSEAVSDVVRYEEMSDTLDSDTFLNKYDSDSVWYKFRRYVIYLVISELKYPFDIEEYKNEISVEDYCAIKEYIKE